MVMSTYINKFDFNSSNILIFMTNTFKCLKIFFKWKIFWTGLELCKKQTFFFLCFSSKMEESNM